MIICVCVERAVEYKTIYVRYMKNKFGMRLGLGISEYEYTIVLTSHPNF